MRVNFIIVLLVQVIISCTAEPEYLFESESLKIKQLSDHTYQHITYLQTDDYGKVACNGMIVIDQKEAIVFDTPPDDETAVELINWLGRALGCRVSAVVPTHFHSDCLGGLGAFHQRGIPSIAHNKTIQLLDSTAVLPWQGFNDFTHLAVGGQEIIVDYLGAGHTLDNVVAYYPNERVMFGGCLIKKLNAGKGYLGDADLEEWSTTVENIKTKYPDIEIVIPGHGPSGGQDLLDYTIEMFRIKDE
ncbi:MAG: subclass B1 metallo-beta-lactamase [Reichenbachiella sp.]|uniref:subclass B1 metallo-beta-lactamase n=1 Tax=Reichenbachiella sp. TaxID=2184521 RepID=UPI0032970F99